MHDVASASNHLGIGDDWDALADGTIEHAIAAGWWDEARDARFDFADAYRDTSVAPAVISSGRHRRTCELLTGGARASDAGGVCATRCATTTTAPSTVPAARARRRALLHRLHARRAGRHDDGQHDRAPAGRARRPAALLGQPRLAVRRRLPAVLRRRRAAAACWRAAASSRPPDSPWWRFKTLLTLVERDWPRHGPPRARLLGRVRARPRRRSRRGRSQGPPPAPRRSERCGARGS